jgi:hypothetical protein
MEQIHIVHPWIHVARRYGHIQEVREDSRLEKLISKMDHDSMKIHWKLKINDNIHNFVSFYIYTYSYVRYLLLKSLEKLMCKTYVRKQIGIFTTLESPCFHRRIWSKKINREFQ